MFSDIDLFTNNLFDKKCSLRAFCAWIIIHTSKNRSKFPKTYENLKLNLVFTIKTYLNRASITRRPLVKRFLCILPS